METNNLIPPKSINRRVRLRRSTDVTVYLTSALTRPGTKIQRYHVRDLSNQGAFIKMKPSSVYRDMQVNLIFALKLGTVTKLHRISAIVARVSRDGIGVRFMTAAEKLAARYYS